MRGLRQHKKALLVIDLQRGFEDPYWGARNNPEAELRALELVNHWRSTNEQVVIVRHDSANFTSPLFPGSPGNSLKPQFEPRPGDWLIPKRVHSAFIGTDLEARLTAASISDLTLAGLTTDQCVSSTARMANNLGFRTTVAEDACACFDQTTADGSMVPADTMHRAHLATLHQEFATVARVDDLIRRRR